VKIQPANLFWIIFLVLVAGGFVYALIPPPSDTSRQKLFNETRQSLRQQGFKTDLSDFNLSTPPEMRSREVALKATAPNLSSRPHPDQINSMEILGTNSAIVLWKQDSLKLRYRTWPENSDNMTWDDYWNAVRAEESALDSACEAAMPGLFSFNLDTSRGSAMLLPHLAMLKNLTQTLGSRTLLALHYSNQADAWTNLLVATRLVTAWEIEPVEVSHLVRFADVKLAFNITWQALQTNIWPDAQLTRLQAEWESVNLFANLAEVIAFQRACRIAAYDTAREEIEHPSLPFIDFLQETWLNPFRAWSPLQSQWREQALLHGGQYDEEKDVMLFFRDREIERSKAMQALTWKQMRQLPGVTNETPFRSRYNSRVQVMEEMRRMTVAYVNRGVSFLGRAAEAEAERRILITAIALERFRGRYGEYPQALGALTPEFLKTPLPDFMDGQPLRYRRTDDGHFLLYSIGLDCVDNGGLMPRRSRNEFLAEERQPGKPLPESDIVWPLPAGAAALEDEQRIQAEEKRKAERIQQSYYYREQQEQSAVEWKQSLVRLSRVDQILATKWSPALDNGFFGGHPAAEFLCNTNSVTNSTSLAELLTPRQVLTGQEPGELTFEFYVSYDTITNHGFFLLLDAETNEEAMFAPDSGARVQERVRAANGDIRLVWHTIFDPPGRHALQVEMTWYNDQGAETWCRGPAIAVTTSNLCQFGVDSSVYDVDLGARFHARLPEKNANFSLTCLTTNGAHLKTLTGSTSNGEFNVVWNLVNDQGNRLHGETFNSLVQITLPDSGRSQTLRGP
jgi:hypothetical protein